MMQTTPRPTQRRWPRAAQLPTVVLAVLALSSCGAGPSDDTGGGAGGDVTILVFAAASLTEVMAEAEQDFEAANPAVDVEVNVAGSASLRTQILEGAPADVVATANPAIMDDLVESGHVTDRPTTLATNRLVIAVAPGNPASVGGLVDLAEPSVFVGLCASEVPCGDLADRALVAAGLRLEPDTREPDVRSLLTKIESGELDAGLVYATDVAASGAGVEAIELPAGLPSTTDYPIAVLAATPQREAATSFTGFLTGSEGRRILADHGFETP